MKSLQIQIPYRSATLYAPSGALYPCLRTMGLSYLTRLPSMEKTACQRNPGNFFSTSSLTNRRQYNSVGLAFLTFAFSLSTLPSKHSSGKGWPKSSEANLADESFACLNESYPKPRRCSLRLPRRALAEAYFGKRGHSRGSIDPNFVNQRM